MLQNGPIMLCFSCSKNLYYASVWSYSAPTDFVYARIMLNQRTHIILQPRGAKPSNKEDGPGGWPTQVGRRVIQHEQKQSALEDYAERAVYDAIQ